MEIAGVLSEMKKFVLPNDYPDMPSSLMHIYLIEAGDRLLAGMSEDSPAMPNSFCVKWESHLLNKRVTDYKDHKVMLEDGHRDSDTYVYLGERRGSHHFRQYRRRVTGTREEESK